MEDLCTTCLCTGRNLCFIGDTGFHELYTLILNEIPAHEAAVVRARVCWACRAALRRLHVFRETARASHRQLALHLNQCTTNPPPTNPSPLQIKHVINSSYPECPTVKSECDVTCDATCDVTCDATCDVTCDATVKSETDETHCEPETFVNELNVEKLGKAGKVVKKVKVKATKGKKKKSKAKKKIKAKKKNKPVPDETPSLENTDDFEADPIEYYEGTAGNEAMDVGELKCEKCGVIFALRGELESHMAIEHVTEKPGKVLSGGAKRPRASGKEVLDEKPKCVECGKVFSSRKTYRYHLNVLHRGQNRYPCPRCGKVYQWKSNLGRHLRSHKARDTGELYCELCDKRFASVATFRQHQRISRRHVAESEFAFVCECGKKFVNKTRLRDHIDWEHLNKIKFRCQLCNKPFKCHTSLYVHTQNVHRDKEKKDNLCHVCGKSYQNSAKLKYHIVAMHTHETPYRCAECDAAFGWYSSLYRHVREVHYKMKQQSKKGKKSKKMANEVLPSLLPPQHHVLPPMHPPLPP